MKEVMRYSAVEDLNIKIAIDKIHLTNAA